MISIDGKLLDTTKPQTWDGKVTLQPGGYILTGKDGYFTLVTGHAENCAKTSRLLLSDPPQIPRCDCGKE